MICPFCLHKIPQCWINQENFVSCVEVDYEKKEMLLNSLMQFFIDAWWLLLIERESLHYAEVCMYNFFENVKNITLSCDPPCSFNNSFY